MSRLPLYLSAPYPCSYRPGQVARMAFVDPRLALNSPQRQLLADRGFRRSGPAHYRPACSHCRACESVRVDVAAFRPSRRQRRCLLDNRDLEVAWEHPRDDDERYALYRRYLEQRHVDGEMDPDDRESFARFLCESRNGETGHLTIRRPGDRRLLAVAVADRLLWGWSAVYTFFEPEAASRSLGRFAVLQLLAVCREARLPWLYLGYRIADCGKMNYKSEFRPQQRYIGEAWQNVND